MKKCEVCKEGESYDLINIGLNVGYELGNYGSGKMEFEVKPRIVGICSIYLCRKCKDKMESRKFLYINLLPKIKEFLKGTMIKKLILESL